MKKTFMGFKNLNTTEYAVDIEENTAGKYDIKNYKLSFESNQNGAFHYKNQQINLSNLEEVYNFIKNYPLGPTCFINELTFTRQDTSLQLNELEMKFISKLDVLARTANIRQLFVIQS